MDEERALNDRGRVLR